MKDVYVPQYLIEEQEVQEGTKPLYTQCVACGHYIHKNNLTSHAKIWCDPFKQRKKRMDVREKPKTIVGGYVLGPGVDPRPIDNPPEQILRGRCRECDAHLADPNDVRCVVCSNKAAMGGKA